MKKDSERSTPVPKKDKAEKDVVNQSTETRTENSGSKLWIVIVIVIFVLAIILAITGVINF